MLGAMPLLIPNLHRALDREMNLVDMDRDMDRDSVKENMNRDID